MKFHTEILQHTKGRFARQPFVPDDWQEHGILRPLFESVVWSADAQRYVRKYRIAWIELARKQGKSEMLAAIALYLLVADGEEGAEIYGCARDRDQARKVFDVALRMVKLSPTLSRRIVCREHAKRLVDEQTASYYEIIAADAAGALGHNPHGIAFDECVSQPNGDLWAAMRTGMGARDQPLMVAATTAGADPQSWVKNMHDEMAKVAEDPDRAPHVFVYMRNTPQGVDPWDEANWYHANPALGRHLSLQALRDEALEAQNNPAAEAAWCQFRLNQWLSRTSVWMPMDLWHENTTRLWLSPDQERERFAGRECVAGFDLASKFDLTAWCLMFLPSGPEEPIEVMWRFWLPESGLDQLDKVNDGRFARWARDGWITVTPGNVTDYDRVIADIEIDAGDFSIRRVDCDIWSMQPIINRVADACAIDVNSGQLAAYANTFERMSPGMDDLMAYVRAGRLEHHGNPVATFCADVCEVRRASYDPNLLCPAKPHRGSSRARIDAIATAVMAANAMRAFTSGGDRRSAYDTHGLMVV